MLGSDANGTIWFFDENRNSVLHSLSDTSLSRYTSEQGDKYTIGSNSVNGFYKDPSGNLWAGGDGSGLSYMSPQQSRIGYMSNESLGGGSIWFFKRFKEDNKIFIGTSYGIVIGRLVNGKILDRKLYRPDGEKKFPVGCVLDLNQDEYLVSSYGRGCWIWNKKTLKFKPHHLINNSIKTDFFYGFRKLSNGNILVLTSVDPLIYQPSTESIIQFDPKLTSFDNIMSSYEEGNGNLWIGTGMGLKIFNSKLELLHSYSSSNDSANAICSNVILDIKPGKNDIVYLATMGGGLCSFDTRAQRFKSIPLSTNPVNIYGIMQFSKDKMLLTTSNGLCLLNLKDGSSVVLNRSNILPFNDFNQMAFYRDDEYIFTAGEKGMLIIKNADLEDAFQNKTELQLLSGNTSVNELVIPAGKQSLDLTILLKNCLPGQLPLFEHWLEGVDEEYHRLPKGQNQISYNYLPPGKYILHVRVVDETGFINAKELVIPVLVEARFWQTAWFRIMAGILALGIIFLIVRYLSWVRLRWKLQKLDAERKIAVERTRISRELHDNLGSQLTYLISGLETSEMMLEFDKLEELPANLNKLQLAARESMQQLRDSIWALAPGSMTIEGLLVQFEKWFYRILDNKQDIQCIVDNEIKANSSIDPIVGLNLFRIMQEAVHNILKHANASQVKVRVEFNDKELLIEISDNGSGIKTQNTEGHGLSSMKQRADDVHAKLEIRENKPSGTRVILCIPKNRLNG
ncbi:MAG: hypothetical protein IPH88_00100 [Bacteroidales bacterium]|nr:hypothetical protein [Bacteroidales bacterium]